MNRMSDAGRERLRAYYERQLRILDSTPRKPASPEVFAKRMRVWQHNSFFGFCKLAEKNMLTIIGATSTTQSAKRRAENIIRELEELSRLLKERID